MAPTICSGKKGESRTIINSNIRRNGGQQGSPQLNQTLSNIVNYVTKGSLNARVSSSLRIKAHSHSDKCTDDDTTGANLKFSFLSDNAVTSSRNSDTENSFDLRLTNETVINDLTPTYSATSLSSPTSPNERTSSSSSTSPYQERRFYRYATIKKNSSDNAAIDLFKENIENKDLTTFKKRRNQIHSSHIRKYYDCKDFNSEEDDDEEEEDVQDYEINCSSDTDMDTDSMSSFDTEKSEKFEQENNPLLRDKLSVKPHQQTENDDDNGKTVAGISSTDGLLSIAIKTIKLVKRNQLLQQRLTQLQMETSEFIQSVLANPENKRFRENMKQCSRKEIDDNV